MTKQNTYKPIQQVRDQLPIRATCFHPSGEAYVVGTNSKAVKVCKYPTPERRRELVEHDYGSLMEPELFFTSLHVHCASVYCATFNPAGNLLVTGSNDQVVHVIKYNPSRHVPEGSAYKLPMHKGTVRDVCFMHDDDSATNSRLLSAGAGNYEIFLTDCNLMKPMQTFIGHESTVMSLTSCEDSTNLFVSGSLDGTIKLWDLRSKNSISTIVGKRQPLEVKMEFQQQFKKIDGDTSVDLSYAENDFPSCATDGVNEIRVGSDNCNIMQQENQQPSSKHLSTLSAGPHLNKLNPTKPNSTGIPVGVVRLDPSGRLLVSGHQDGSCMLYDILAGKIIQLFQAHESEIRSMNFSPNSHYLLTGSYDKKVKLTDLQGLLNSPLPCVEVVELDDKVVQIAWHPNDYNFVTTCANGSATLWIVPDFDEWRDSIVMESTSQIIENELYS